MRNFQIVSVVPALAALSLSCSSSPAPPASVYLDTYVGEQEGSSMSTCNVRTTLAPFFQLGTMGTPVANGALYALPAAVGGGEAAVTVDCVVHPDGNGFDVNIQVSQGEADAFSFNTTTPLTDTPGAQSGISVSLGLNPDTYGDSTDCTFTLSPMGNPSITAGRIWGTVTCPTSTYPEVNVTCESEATFILQNCGE